MAFDDWRFLDVLISVPYIESIKLSESIELGDACLTGACFRVVERSHTSVSRARLKLPLSSVALTLGFLDILVSEAVVSVFRFRDSSVVSVAGESRFFASAPSGVPFLGFLFLSLSGRFSPSSKTSEGRS